MARPERCSLRKSVLALASLLTLALLPALAGAASWQVIPIRLDFDQRSRSGVITVTNDGTERLTLKLEAMAWVQNAEGKDGYLPSSELIFFPKVLTIPAKEERVIRTGINVPPVKQEKAFRLFIKEEPGGPASGATTVAIALQFGVPVFARPALEEVLGELAGLSLQDGVVQAEVRNTGNSHFRIRTLGLSGKNAAGEELFQQDLPGWYLLAGAARIHTAPIPAEICRQLMAIDLSLNADRLQLNGRIDVDPAQCPAP